MALVGENLKLFAFLRLSAFMWLSIKNTHSHTHAILSDAKESCLKMVSICFLYVQCVCVEHSVTVYLFVLDCVHRRLR